MVGLEDKEQLLRKVFTYLIQVDFIFILIFNNRYIDI